MSYARVHQKKKSSFLEKFQGKISTVSKDGNLRSVSGSSEGASPALKPVATVKPSLPQQRKPSPLAAGPPRGAPHRASPPLSHGNGDRHREPPRRARIGVDDLAALVGQPAQEPVHVQQAPSYSPSQQPSYAPAPGQQPSYYNPPQASYRSAGSDPYSHGMASGSRYDEPDSPPRFDDYDDGMYDDEEVAGGRYSQQYQEEPFQQPSKPQRQARRANQPPAAKARKQKRSAAPSAPGGSGYARAHKDALSHLPSGQGPPSSGFREMAYIRKPESLAAQDYKPKEESYSPEEALYFSKKARPVEYKPKTLREYKAQKADGYYELGGLGVDLNDDELVAQRAKKERMKAYAKKVRELQPRSGGKKNLQEEIERQKEEERKRKIERSRRAKAQEYAKKIPKPKATDDDIDTKPSKGPRPPQHYKQPSYGGYQREAQEWDELAALEAAHDAARNMESRIRKEMGGY